MWPLDANEQFLDRSRTRCEAYAPRNRRPAVWPKSRARAFTPMKTASAQPARKLSLDIVVPTFNRAELMTRTVRSLLSHNAPPGWDVRVLVVDNGSTDDTHEALVSLESEAAGRLRWVVEPAEGSSNARNAGIRWSRADVIAFVDDDEEITSTWYRALAEAFSDPGIDFIGGPMLPNWVNGAPPTWLPVWEFSGVLSIFEGPATPADFGVNFPYMLVSGNCAARRRVFNQIAHYNPELGRMHRGLGSSEDDDLTSRLLEAGLHGRFIPEFTVLHAVPPERMTARYFRRWIEDTSASHVLMARATGRSFLAELSRKLLGTLARRAIRLLAHLLTLRLTRKELFIFELSCRQILWLGARAAIHPRRTVKIDNK